LSNEEGEFHIPIHSLADSIGFSCIGYAARALPAAAVNEARIISLVPSVTELRSLNVTPAQDALYDLVARCARAMRRAGSQRTKAFFELDTRMDEQPVETIEAFYNVDMTGTHITRLDLKHGRIGIAPVGDRFFVSLSATRTLALLDPCSASEHFPLSPLRWTNARRIRKHYRIVERASNGDDGSLLLHLSPRDSSGAYFSMDLWLDPNTAHPRSLTLFCWDCSSYPFRPLKPEDRIEHIDMRSNTTFNATTGAPEPEHMELDYTMAYRDTAGLRAVRTKGVMHFFDRGQPFILPFFRYDEEQHDYRKITFQPYDSGFWATAPTLVRTGRQERDRGFFAKHGYLTGSTVMPELKTHTFFESNYAWWSSQRRISLRTLPPPSWLATPQAKQRTATIAVNEVNLEAQLYLDVDTSSMGNRIFTATVFDGFRSYYRLTEQPITDAFLNIFFDLCEVERRQLDAALRSPGLDLAALRRLHVEATRRMERVTGTYLKEVSLGNDHAAMVRWNEHVRSALGIDNLALFKQQ